MKKILIILYITFITFTFSQSYANETINQINLYALNPYFSANDSHFKIRFNRIIERYDFSQIEGYVQNRYSIYYKYYEEYLISKPHEIAGKFGLTSIYVSPDFRQYDNSKLILARSLWSDKVSLRYLAPLHDMSDFELMMSFRPNKSFSIIIRSELKGESSIAAAITRPFGGKSRDRDDTIRHTKSIIRRITGIKM
jgi:hypothetical protein